MVAMLRSFALRAPGWPRGLRLCAPQ